ncbi:MAG TPA: carboxypeptidase-like regulatory domain-containing protein [Gemmatimonadaceae bacterium]|nr:carboxypeptidase-like regulatory domain-containing protein [Gemmatimonadaceae bacterium]
MLLIAAAGPVLAQQPTYVHGRVVARGGPPLQGAQLRVLPSGPSAETDPDGAFTLGPLAAGTYHIRVRRIGFQPDTVTLKLPHAEQDFVIQLTAAPQTLDPVFSSALEQDLPRVMDRMRQHLGATVFGPELMKQYPGLSIDDILATDSTVYPFMRGGSFPSCHPSAYLNGKELPGPMIVTRSASQRPLHLIFPDLDIRRFVRMKDVAVVEVYRFAKRSNIEEPWIPRDAGTYCGPVILIWTKDFMQRPYKGR